MGLSLTINSGCKLVSAFLTRPPEWLHVIMPLHSASRKRSLHSPLWQQPQMPLCMLVRLGSMHSPRCPCRSSMFFRFRLYRDSSSSPPCATPACAFSAPTASFLEYGVCTQLNHRSLCLTSSKILPHLLHLFTSLIHALFFALVLLTFELSSPILLFSPFFHYPIFQLSCTL